MKHIRIILSAFILCSSTFIPQNVEERTDLKKYFDEYGHEGCFVLYDLKKDSYLKYNSSKDVQKDLFRHLHLKFLIRLLD